MKTFSIDIDGTICTEPPDDGSLDSRLESFRSALPITLVVDEIRDLCMGGARVILYTARGMNIVKRMFPQLDHFEQGRMADKLFRPVTEQWLKDNGISYHTLVFGKLSADHYVDDKAVTPTSFIGGFYGKNSTLP
jgi:hypothetical protein